MSGISFTSVMVGRVVIADVCVFALFTAIQWLSLSPLNASDSDADGVRATGASAMAGAAGAGITAVGILVPLTLFTVQRVVNGDQAFRKAVTEDLFVGECWFALSLAVGLLVLWFVAFKAPTRNVVRTGYISLTFSLQLCALLIGIVRVLVATFTLIGG